MTRWSGLICVINRIHVYCIGKRALYMHIIQLNTDNILYTS